ncbi:hypothetical protein chiPu_0023882, partial [Chiloscyllium punctatum]|nr:hypothetical protein [Chiloscyllium punctatum]
GQSPVGGRFQSPSQSPVTLGCQDSETSLTDDSSPVTHGPTADSFKRSPQRRRNELVLLGCANILSSVALSCDLVSLGRQQMLHDEQEKRREGIFQRTGRCRSSDSPPSRLAHRKESVLPSLEASSSVTLLSLSSVSDCNSTRSLLQADGDEAGAWATPDTAESPHQAPPVNPLLDLTVETFKRNPEQSLTPTHVSAASAVKRGHRRIPSDSAIRQQAQAQTQTHRRSPSDSSTHNLVDTGKPLR